MNESYFPGNLDKIHQNPIMFFIPESRAQNAFLKKKLSDYYSSKLIPDFFYHTSYSNNYLPTIVATRVTLTFSVFALLSFFVYKRNFAEDVSKGKKYSFNIFSQSYLKYEKQMLLNEKRKNNKIIF